jgi:hypothetical protein
MAETHIIEVRAGRGEPPSLELRPGLELAPLSVGTGGAWQVSAAGVQVVHLYLYFDGQTLFLQSADPNDPPMVDGAPVPAEWTPAPARCTITFGQARLVSRPAGQSEENEAPSQEEPTIAEPFPENFRAGLSPPTVTSPVQNRPAPAAARPFKPGAFVSAVDDESTRLQPVGRDDSDNGPDSGDSTRVEPLGAVPGMPGTVRPAAGAPWARSATGPGGGAPEGAGGFQSGGPIQGPPHGGFHAPRQFPPPPVGPASDPTGGGPLGPSGPPSGLLNVPPPSLRKPDAPETLPEKIKREWASAPPLRKGLFAALPVAVVVALWLVFAGSPPPPPAQANGAGGSSASASAPSATATPIPTVAQVPTAWPPPVDPTPIPTPRPAPPPPPAGSAGAAATGDAGANTDKRERQAADFVATHQYDQAIRLYEQLAAERPQTPAFHEAARILREKVEAGTP